MKLIRALCLVAVGIALLGMITSCSTTKSSTHVSNRIGSGIEERIIDGEMIFKLVTKETSTVNNSKVKYITFQLLTKGVSLKQQVPVRKYRDGTLLYEIDSINGRYGWKGTTYKSKARWETIRKIKDKDWNFLPNADVEITSNTGAIHLSNSSYVTDSNGEITVIAKTNGPIVFDHLASQNNGIVAKSYINGSIPPETINYLIRASFKDRKAEISGVAYDLRSVAKAISRDVHNSKIKSIRMIPTDIDSRVSFGSSNITISGRPPSAREILSPYFNEPSLLSTAVMEFPEYLITEGSAYGTGNFLVYPGTYQITIKNKKYYYLEKKLSVTKSSSFDVLMSELGTKHRVRIVDR
jgi:hypothetical protein